MKTIKSVLIGALVALLGSSAQAASQTVSTTVEVGGTKQNITSSSNVTSNNRTWSEQTGTDTSVATVRLTSSSNVKKPTISVTGVGAGYTTYVAKNNATTGGDKGLTFTCNITVTDSKDETVTLEPRGSVQKTCTYSGKYKQGTTDGNWSATTTDGSVATVSSVSGSAAEVTPTITAGSKIGTATVTVKNAYVTYTYTVEVKEPKRVVSGQTLSFPSTKNVTANWYYRVVSADGDSVGVSPAEATQQGGQTAPVEIEVEGLDVTESPVTITLQQRQSSWGNFSDVETFEVVVTEPPFVDYGTNTVVIAKGKTSDALSVESAASAQWKFWSENTSVATVSKATGATATKSDNFTITAVDTESKSTYCVASNKYAKYTFKVEGPKEEVNMGEIMMSHGECVTLTNELGEAIAWTGAGEDTYTTENPNVAMVVSSNGYACVTNMVHDGAVEVVLETATTKYTYLVRCMTVEIEKTIKAASVDKPSDKSNATIRVTTHVLYGVHGIPTNNILFVGSLCGNHQLDASKLKAQLDKLATKGKVDYWLYANTGSSTAGNTVEKYKGTLQLSNTFTQVSMISSGHRNLKAYLNRLDQSLDPDHKSYDYVVLSFDSARLAASYPSTDNTEMETRVANLLKWYYDNNRVIWLTDAAYTPQKTGDAANTAQWKGLCAMVDPATYLKNPSNPSSPGTKIDAQAVYSNTQKVEELLDANVKMATYDTKLVDNVLNLNNSLTIVKTGSDTSEVHFYTWAGKSAPVAPDGGVIADLPKDSTHWAEEPDSAFKVDPVNYQVTANVSNITQETWNMFEISIVDNGTFLQECLAHDPPLAELDPKTGKYVVNPNDGPANVTLYAVEGGKEIQVQSTAKATSVLWPLEKPKPWTLSVNSAEMTYDGTGTNVTFEVTDEDGNVVDPSKYTITYSNATSTAWGSISSYTNATDGAQDVWVRVVMNKTSGYVQEPQEVEGTVTVNKRPITLTAASETWLYDGKEHSTNEYSVTDGSWVTGEGLKDDMFTTMTSASVITNVGEVANEIDKDALEAKDGTKLDNYDIKLVEGLLTVSGIDITASAEDVEMVYCETPTNITVKIGETYAPHGNFKITYAHDTTEHIEDEPEHRPAMMVRPSGAPDDTAFTLTTSPKYMDAGTNRVWYKVVDLNNNYSNYYGSAYIRILPRPVAFRFPKVVKPYDGTTGYSSNVETNLNSTTHGADTQGGTDRGMVAGETFKCTATGSFTNANVGAGETYFKLAKVKVEGTSSSKASAFLRNYRVSYLGDGEYNEMTGYTGGDYTPTEAKSHTDGEITVVPMVIGGVTQPGTAGQQIPVDPTDPTTWTNGAISVVKEYDAVATNIVVTVTEPAAATVYYSYDDNGKPAGDWKTYADFDGYVNVTNVAPVWYKVEYPNYLPVTNRAFVTITPAQIKATTKDGTKETPWAYAESVEIWIDDLPKGGSTNIVVESGLFGSDQPTYRYSVKDPAKGAEWIDAASFEGFSLPTLATNVWCEVSGGSNYLPTNVVAHVAIWQREAEIEGDDNVGNAKEIQDELEKNAEKYKTDEYPYVKLRVTVTKAEEVPADDAVGRKIRTTKTEADKQADAIIAAASTKAKVAKSEIKADLYDLVLERTYDKAAGDALAHGSYNPSKWDDIGANGNQDLYKFEFDYNKPDGYDLVGVYKYHDGAPVWLSEGANQADHYTITTKGGKQILTIWLTEFCVGGACFMPHPTPPPSKGCDWNPEPEEVEGTAWVYSWKFSGKTSIGAKTEIAGTPGMVSACDWNPGTDAQGEVIRVAGALAIKGYTYLCEPECSMESFNMFKDAAWTFGHKGWSFYMTKPYKDIVAAEINDAVANVIGREGGKFELEGTAMFVSPNLPAEEFDLTFAGFGKYNAGKKRVTSVSGKFAGTAKQPYYVPSAAEIKKAKRNLCAPAIVWDCAADSWIDDDTSVAYGNFSVKLDEAASKKFYKDGSVVQLPDWAEALIKKQN